MGADGDLMKRTESFMSDRSVGLVIDGHQCKERGVETEVPYGSPVSLILFEIYLKGVFKEVEKAVERCTATSFANNCRWLMVADLVE